jgi:hypothetical protein
LPDDEVSRPNDAAEKLHILLLCDYQTNIAATVADHIQSLEALSENRFYRLSMLGDMPVSLDLSRFDALIVHYTLVACSDFYLSPASRARIAAFKGLKALFIQDEYRHVNASVRAMRELGIDVLFTCVPQREIEKVYPDEALPGVHKVNVLTGYVPVGLTERKALPFEARRVDVGYRGRKVPAWLGELGHEKWRIGIRFAEDAARYGLVCDIGYREEDRLYGDAWTVFLGGCKAVLGVESGASVFDFTGDIKKSVDAHVAREPATSFETLRDLYFKDAEGRISLAQISPRSFESAALRTLMILYEGEYSGILVPWRHYVPLKKDHSNMDEVVAVLRDPARWREITDHAFDEIACDERNSFRAFVRTVDAALREAWRPEMRAAKTCYQPAKFRLIAAWNLTNLRRRTTRNIIAKLHWLVFGGLMGWMSPAARDRAEPHVKRIYQGALGWLSRQRAG